MRPKALKFPFAGEKRRVIIEDRVWYIPRYYDRYEEFHFPGWASLFGNERPVHVEYCAGNGHWIAAKAQECPQINWVAVEKRFDRVRKIWSKMKNHDLDNLVIIHGEAYIATRHYFPDDSVGAVYINFPDPWPKRRHHKHRLMKPDFAQEIGRILRKEGAFTLVTDDEEYSALFIDCLCQHGGFVSRFPPPFWGEEMAGYGTSYFEDLWRKLERQIRYHQFVREDGDCR